MSFLIERVFSGLTMMLTAVTLIPLSILVIRINKKEEYRTLMPFLVLGSVSLFLMSVFLNTIHIFGVEYVYGVSMSIVSYVFGTFTCFALLGVLWQIYEYSEIEL